MTQIHDELSEVLDDPELDDENKIEAFRTVISNHRPCTPEQSQAIWRDLVAKYSALPAVSTPKPKPNVEHNWLTAGAAAAYAKCSKETLWRWRGDGLRAGRGGRILQSDLDVWLAGDAMPPSDPCVNTEWLTLAQAAAVAGVSKQSIWRWGNEGLKIARRGLVVRVRADLLDDYLKQNRC